MTSSDISIRQATAADVVRFYGDLLQVRVRGFVGEAGGSPVIMGGVFFDGGERFVFSSIKPEAAACKKAIVRIANMVSDLAGDDLVFATQDADIETSPGLLSHLGFSPLEEYHGDRRLWMRWRECG